MDEDEIVLDIDELSEFIGASVLYAIDVMAKNQKVRNFAGFITKKYKLEELFEPCINDDKMIQVHSSYQSMFEAFVENYKENYASKSYDTRQSYREVNYFILYIYYLPLEEYFDYNYAEKDERLDSNMYRACHSFINDIQKNFPQMKKFIAETQKIKRKTYQSSNIFAIFDDYEIDAVKTMAQLYLEMLYDMPYGKIIKKSERDEIFKYECFSVLSFNQFNALSITIFFLKTIIERVNTENDMYLELPSKGLINGITTEIEEKARTNSVILNYKEEFQKKQKTELPIDAITLESIYENTKKYLATFPTENIYNTVRTFTPDSSIYDDKIELPKGITNVNFTEQLYNRHFDTPYRSEKQYEEIPIEYRYLSKLVERLSVLPIVYEFTETYFSKEPITDIEKHLAEKIISDSYNDMKITINKIQSRKLRKKCSEDLEQFKTFFEDKEKVAPIYSLILHHLKALHSAQKLQRMLFNMENVIKSFQSERKESKHYREQLEHREKCHREELSTLKTSYDHAQEKIKQLNKTVAQFDSIKAQLDEKNEQLKILEAQQEEIQYLNEQLQLLSESDELETQMNECKSSLDRTLDGHPFTDDIYQDFIKQLDSDKTLILGGHEKIQQRMQKLLPNAMIKDASALGHDIDSWVKRMDYIVLNTHVMNHSMSKLLKNTLKRSGINTPIMYVNSRASNSKVTFSLIYDEYKRYKNAKKEKSEEK